MQTRSVNNTSPPGINLEIKCPRRWKRQRAQPHPLAFAYTIPDAQSMGAPGRTKIYELVKNGKLKLLCVGGRTMVDGNSLTPDRYFACGDTNVDTGGEFARPRRCRPAMAGTGERQDDLRCQRTQD